MESLTNKMIKLVDNKQKFKLKSLHERCVNGKKNIEYASFPSLLQDLDKFLHFTFSPFFPFKIDSSSIQYIPTTVPLPTPPSYPHPVSPKSTPLPFCFQKREDFQKMRAKQDKARCTMTSPSYLDWRKKPNRRKKVSQAGKRVRDTSAPTKHQAKCHNIH